MHQQPLHPQALMKKQAIDWLFLSLVLGIGFGLRVALALGSEQIHHPDEIFQYLEQAHRLVFGYGYIPWEYRFGIRSWILPGLLAVPLYLCKLFQLDDPHIYVPLIKLLTCFFSVSVIYAAYIIGRNLWSEGAGKLAAVLTCSWYELVYFAHRSTPETLGAYFFMGSFALATSQPTGLVPIGLGMGMGLSIGFRFQYSPALFILGLFIILKRWQWRPLCIAGLSFLITVLSIGFVDYFTWGAPFLSYFENYVFNKVYNVSALFGVHTAGYFVDSLAIASVGLFILTTLLNGMLLYRTWPLISMAWGVILTHSWIPHKEHRFIFVAIPLLLIAAAIAMENGLSRLTMKWKRSLTVLFLSFWLMVSLGSLFFWFPFQEKIYSYLYFRSINSLVDRQDTLVSYLTLAQKTDVFGILHLSLPWSRTGGYYYLHQDVPIYFADEHGQQLESSGLNNYVSHIICDGSCPEIPGFRPYLSVGNLQILKLVQYPEKPKVLMGDRLNVMKSGIDDVYQPRVKPFP